MKKFTRILKDFFFPRDNASRWRKVLPYVILGALTVSVLISGAYGWEYTNSPEFCGTVCHTMPPEYTSYLTSPHARVDCVDCHIGKGFIATRITRKAGDAKHIVSLLFHDYEFPITAGNLRPAQETCEKCHFPAKFSDDSLREIKSYNQDINNTAMTTYLVMKTGGGTKRLGLGQGIHWHVENAVKYYPTDAREQEIPFVQVVREDGTLVEYIDIESGIDKESIATEDLKQMDCITCHNRITHLVNPPEKIVDTLMARGIISDKIPEFKRVAVEVFYRDYTTTNAALANIDILKSFYETYYPAFFEENADLVEAAIEALRDAYVKSVYPEQKSNWDSHPNNVGHQFSPGCFRCHDGKHLNADQEAIRLECNVCHAIPVVAGYSDYVTDIEISRGPEPESHRSPNWISMHRDVFDQTCQNCHTTEDPGGVSNQSFCSNIACHGNVFNYAGFDAPSLRAIIAAQIPVSEEPIEISESSEIELEGIPVEASENAPSDNEGDEIAMPEPEAPEPVIPENPTFENTVGPIFRTRCGACHSSGGMAGLDLSTYRSAMYGSISGAVIIENDAQGSLLVKIQSSEQPHFGRLSPEELAVVIYWIDHGAAEK